MRVAMYRVVPIAFLLMALSACQTAAYYTQAASGQIRLLLARQSMEEVLQRDDLSDDVRQKLQQTLQARAFAITELGLPDNGSYTLYADVDRQHLVWNVFAAPAWSLDPVSWCFPIAGCVSYRGYFSEPQAQRYADRLRARGLDVYVAGVDAYSTLGWFRDPLPSTVMRRPTYRLAGLIFHELSHQLIYVPGDTVFNESFASFVEQEGLRRWLLAQGDEDTFRRYLQEQALQRRFTEFVMDYRQRFAQLYTGDEVDVMAKQALQSDMRASWQQSDDSVHYSSWFAGPLNNAQLATVAAYYEWVPAFEALYAQQGGVLEDFYRAVGDLAALPAAERRQHLQALAAQH